MRRELERLVEMLARIPGLGDLAMTTNGSVLARKAGALKDAGLRRITVSLDSLDNEAFAAINDVGFPVERVLAGIDAAAAAGLGAMKINMVVKGGVNEDGVVPMARHFRDSGRIVRFIEYMDVGHTNGWRMDDVVPAAEIVAMIDAELPLEPVAPNYPGEVVERWRYRDGSGEIGVIASVTRPFCGGCMRARLSADGKLFTCLFATKGHDLRALLRGGAPTRRSPRRSARSGGCGTTATRNCARPRPPRCRKSRCPTSAVGAAAACRAGSEHATDRRGVVPGVDAARTRALERTGSGSRSTSFQTALMMGRGSSWSPGSRRGWSCRSGRCSASSTVRPAGGRGRPAPRARSCAASPARPACGGASRPTNCDTRMRSRWRARACR